MISINNKFSLDEENKQLYVIMEDPNTTTFYWVNKIHLTENEFQLAQHLIKRDKKWALIAIKHPNNGLRMLANDIIEKD